MIANVKARYSNGALVPLVPLDLEEGEEVMVSIEDAPLALPSDSTGASLESRGQAIYEQRIRSRVEGTEHGKLSSSMSKAATTRPTLMTQPRRHG